MYQYYIFIVRKSKDGEYSHDVKWAYDVDATKAKAKGNSEYYATLSAAELEETAFTTVTLISDVGEVLECKCIAH